MNDETVAEEFPKFRLGKDIESRYAPLVGTLACSFKQMSRAFGRPTFSAENNDFFDGSEKCAWHIEFETGHTAVIAENRPFGDSDYPFEKANEWKINSRHGDTINWIKSILRYANPSD